LRLFTAREYQRLADLGLLGEDERIELIEGLIVQLPPKSPPHAAATTRANMLLQRLVGEAAVISVHNPILLDDLSEPEPDLVLAYLPDERDLEHHPTPEDIYFVMEIADSSVSYDRDVKGPLYAQNGIRQYCLLNLQDRELEDYREPSPNGYRTKRTYTADESFTLAAFPKISVKVSDLLPPLKAPARRRRK
jgi:Uma2 family endonuclease